MMNKGLLYVVGIGPGASDMMSAQADEILKKSDVIVGYTVYVELIKSRYPNAVYRTTPMKRELERCHLAYAEAEKGQTVSMVCSGDAGVYGMAGPILSLALEYPQVEVAIIPGITAALSGAALLGAPLTHDFVVISLSDLLTPWELIVKRLRLAAEGDFVICLYNPSSRHRPDYLQKACAQITEITGGSRICGIVKNIGRVGETKEICTLEELSNKEVDMFTTVFIGNSKTREIAGNMVTPRGYEIES